MNATYTPMSFDSVQETNEFLMANYPCKSVEMLIMLKFEIVENYLPAVPIPVLCVDRTPEKKNGKIHIRCRICRDSRCPNRERYVSPDEEGTWRAFLEEECWPPSSVEGKIVWIL